MIDIPSLARHRAHCAAVCEALGEDKLSRDPVERAAQHEAYARARETYVKAEADYQRATALLTQDELADIQRMQNGTAAHAS